MNVTGAGAISLGVNGLETSNITGLRTRLAFFTNTFSGLGLTLGAMTKYSGPAYATIRALDYFEFEVRDNSGARIGIYPLREQAECVAKIFESRAMKIYLARNKRDATLKRNPVPPSSKSLTAQVKRAKNLFKRFTGRDSEYADKVQIPEYPDAVVCIGDVAGIMYNTIRDGKAEKYLHRFHASSRPLFCVSPDGAQLFLLGGAYDFTERGIVDTDPKTGRARE